MNDPFDWTMGSLFNNVNLIDSLGVCQAEWCSGPVDCKLKTC
jgi:hypothetical protein